MKLTENKRILLNLPRFIIAKIGEKFFNIYPLLRFRYNELKKYTTDSMYDSIFSTGTRYKIKHELIKITRHDLPKNKLKLKNWNIYLVKNHKNSENRDVVYISKDKLKKDDMCQENRLNDDEIYNHNKFNFEVNYKGERYPSELKSPTEYPCIIQVAKYDNIDSISLIKQEIQEICNEFKNNILPIINTWVSFDICGDNLVIHILKQNEKLIFTDKLNNQVIELADKIKEYLKIHKYKLEYNIKYEVSDDVYYYGNKDRFGTDILAESIKYTRKNNSDFYYDRYHKCINIHNLNNIYNESLCLHANDLKILLSDLDNCKKSILAKR
jgi:hypothetical protein